MNLCVSDQVLDSVAQNLFVEVRLFVCLRIHEMMVRAIGIEVFHLAIVEDRFLHSIFRPEPMIDDRPGTQVAQLCLHHAPPVPRRDVLVIDYLKEFSIVQNRVSTAQLGCLNHYRQTPESLMKTTIVPE